MGQSLNGNLPLSAIEIIDALVDSIDCANFFVLVRFTIGTGAGSIVIRNSSCCELSDRKLTLP
jgi:hypothetical protein